MGDFSVGALPKTRPIPRFLGWYRSLSKECTRTLVHTLGSNCLWDTLGRCRLSVTTTAKVDLETEAVAASADDHARREEGCRF